MFFLVVLLRVLLLLMWFFQINLKITPMHIAIPVSKKYLLSTTSPNVGLFTLSSSHIMIKN